MKSLNINKEVDIDFLVFVERYATDLLRWDILTFFAQHPDDPVSVAALAERIGRNPQTIRHELGDLRLMGVVHQTDRTGFYQLTAEPRFRRATLKLGEMAPA